MSFIEKKKKKKKRILCLLYDLLSNAIILLASWRHVECDVMCWRKQRNSIKETKTNEIKRIKCG